MERIVSGEIDINVGDFSALQTVGTIKLEPVKIDNEILLSPLDFVNYVESKMPGKEAKNQKGLFPLKLYESEKKTKYTLSELGRRDNLASQIYQEEKDISFAMAIDDTIIFSDTFGNIKFYSLKENKVTKILQYPLKNTSVKYKSYAFDVTSDQVYAFVGYENGEIAIFEKLKCKQIIKTGNAFNIINIKLIQHANKQFQLLASDIKGNVLLITLKEKSITDIFKGMKNIKGIKGSFEEKINKVFQCNPNTPYFLIDLLKFKEAEIASNKSLKDLSRTFAIANSENVVLYSYSSNDIIKKLHSFNKPSYIKDNCLPDVALGLGKQPSSNESTDGDADLLVLFLISWEKVVYLHVLTIMNNSFDFVMPSGFYVNEANIVRIGFLNLSTIYLIDQEGHFKILNSRNFNQGSVEFDEKTGNPTIPESNANAEIQNLFKFDQIKYLSYLNNKNLQIYLSSIINNKNRYEFFAFSENTIYQQSLIEYNKSLEALFEKAQWDDLFLLGENIYKGKMSSMSNIPIKIDERKKKVKDYLQGIINKYLTHPKNDLENYKEKLIEFCLEVDLSNYLFEKIINKNNMNSFLDKLEPFIICNKLMQISVPKNIIIGLINLYSRENDLEQLDQLDRLLTHFNIASLNHPDIIKRIQELFLVSPQIYIAINDPKQLDYYKPVILIYEKYCKAPPYENFTNYKDLVKGKKMEIYKIKNYKQYWGHKLLWYLQKTFDGKKFPDFIEYIEGSLYFNAVTKITYWLLTETVFNDLILLETKTFFNIINFLFSNEDILEAFEENDEDKTKRAENLNVLKSGQNSKYKSNNIAASDLASYIMTMGDELLKSDKIPSIVKDKIKLYFQMFIIIVGKKIRLEVDRKKEAIKFVIQNYNKYKSNLDITQKIIGILEGKDFEIKDYDDILLIMQKGSFDDIRLFIHKKKKQYIDCLNLLLDSETNINNVDETIFSFINMTLTRLQIKKKKIEYNNFKKELKKNLIKIAQKSLENCYTLINFWFSKDKIDCVASLKEMPKLQLDYVEYSIKKIIENKEKNNDFYEKEDYIKFILEKHVLLLCNMNRKNEIISWLRKLNEYPIKECITICKRNKVYDCLIFLYKKEGNTTEALKICYEIIKNTFNEILDNIKSKDFNKELYDTKKIEFIKFIEDTIGAIESEDKENAQAKNDDHELWSDLLGRLYDIQETFTNELNNVAEKNEIYSDFSELILNQIQNLITRMSPYIGEKNVFDFVLKVNPKAKVIEFKPFFNETLKSYGIETYILNYYKDSINEYSLDESKILEQKNAFGDNFDLPNISCDVCKNSFDSVNANSTLVRFKCQHMQHSQCCTNKMICLKCLKNNYEKLCTKAEVNNSKDADEKNFSEFLRDYKAVKKEMEKDKKNIEENKEKKEKEEKKKGTTGFNKRFRKLYDIEHYDRKKRQNFLLQGVEFYMK